MGMINLLRTESLSGKETRYMYKIDGSPVDYCKKIMSLAGFSHDKVRLTLEGEEMQPDKKVLISSFAELIPFTKESIISSCLFSGSYYEDPVEMVVNYDLNSLYIVTEDFKVVEAIKKELEE